MKCGCGSAVYWTQSTQTDRRHTWNTGQCRMERRPTGLLVMSTVHINTEPGGRATVKSPGSPACRPSVHLRPPHTGGKLKTYWAVIFFFLLFFFLLFYFICFFQSGWRGGGWRVERRMKCFYFWWENNRWNYCPPFPSHPIPSYPSPGHLSFFKEVSVRRPSLLLLLLCC